MGCLDEGLRRLQERNTGGSVYGFHLPARSVICVTVGTGISHVRQRGKGFAANRIRANEKPRAGAKSYPRSLAGYVGRTNSVHIIKKDPCSSQGPTASSSWLLVKPAAG